MASTHIDFSSKIKDLNLEAQDQSSSTFVEKVISFLSAKISDHNSKNLNSKVSLSQIKEVYKRGVSDAIRLEKPIGLWAIARVNMFFKLSKNCSSVSVAYKKLDKDIINDQSFFIDDGIRDDVIFTYEQISEARFESESFNLNLNQDHSFVDLEEYAEANFPKVLKESEIIKDEALKKPNTPKYKKEEEEKDKEKNKEKTLEKVNTKYKKEE
jgi:hypothetical protein